jgi:hypothetical protein
MKRTLAALAVLALLAAPGMAQSKLDQAIAKAYDQLQKGKPNAVGPHEGGRRRGT